MRLFVDEYRITLNDPVVEHVITACGKEQPTLPWRNTSKFSREKINCMACIANTTMRGSL